MSLQEISSTSGLSRSSLHRHRQHLDRVPSDASNISPPVPTDVSVRQEISDAVLVPQSTAPAVAVAGHGVETEPSYQTETKAELLRRLEYLWQESLDGLQATKEPVRISKPDGSSLEIPGDLRARAAFIREGRQVLELVAAANGDLSAGHAEARILIVLPVMAVQGDKNSDDCVVDIEPRR